MTLDDFLEFLESHGIEFHTTFASVVINDCPSCGSSKDKVWLYKDRPNDAMPFFGKCMKCEEKWNSRSYLLAMGIEPSEVRALHGYNEDFTLSVVPAIDLLGSKPEVIIKPPEPPPCDISMFVPLKDVPKCEVTQYAINRGFTPQQKDNILIDYYSQAVVFVVKDEGKVVGYQKRFLKPWNPKMKTMSSPGFQKRNYIMEFPNNGDICVCEGPFTALSAWHYGYHGICTFGSSVGERQLDIIAATAIKTGKAVCVAFDKDAAGRKGFRRVAIALKWRDVFCYKVRPEKGNDLNDSWIAKAGVVVVPQDKEDFSIPDIDILGNIDT